MDDDVIRVPGGEVLSLPASVRVDPYDLERASSSISFVLRSLDDASLIVHEDARFLGPPPAR
jgi:hypothetical protein